MVDKISQLADRILELFETYAAQLSAKFPHVRVQVYSFPVGSQTDCKAHDFVIDCILTNAPPECTDNIALSVSFYQKTQPKINADVVWGHPSVSCEASFYEDWRNPEDWPVATKETLRQPYDDLPRLYKSLEQALERGHPRDTFA